MSEKNDEGGAVSGRDDDVAKLFRLARTPAELSEDELRSAREAARATWKRQLRARRLQRVSALGALAAGLVLVAGGLQLWRSGRSAPSPPVALVEHRVGAVTISPATGAETGEALHSGTVIVTGGDGRIAIRLGDASVRLDVGSRLEIATARSLSLHGGAVYVDSGHDDDAPVSDGPLAIDTPLGRVTDVGTQFEVRLSETDVDGAQSLRVRVREGEARIDTGGTTHRAAAGDELVLTADGRVRRTAIAPHDQSWRWAADARPPLQMDGQTLAAFLDEATHELGLRWRLVEPPPEQAPAEILLHGSAAGLTLDEAIDLALAGSGLQGRRVGGELLVSGGSSPPADAGR